MGKLVNVIVNGKTVAVPEEDAARIEGANRGRIETPAEAASASASAADAERASGFGQGLLTVVENGLNSATAGLYAGIARNVSPDYAADMENRGEQHPVLKFAGELGSFAIPGGLGDAAAHAGEAVTAKLVEGAVNPLTRGAAAGVSAAGRAVEGGIIGAGGHVASTNVTGDPLTVEGTLLSIGTGALLNVGAGAVADKVRSIGIKAKGITTEAEAQKADVELVKTGQDVFNKPRDSWEGFKESLKSAATDEAKAASEQKKAAEEYAKWIGGPGANQKIEGALRKAEKVRNELQSRLAQTKYGQAITDTGEAFSEATAQVGKLKEKGAQLTESTEDWPSTMKSVDDTIAEVRNRYAPKGADEPLYKPKTEGYTGSFDERGHFDKGDAFVSARTKKMPISEKMDAELSEFSERASRIRQMRQGGYKMKGNKWVKDANAAPNPEGALKELRQLRADFSKRFGGVEFPDLPAAPESVSAPLGGAARPAEGPAGQMDEVRRLSNTSRELSEGISSARAKFAAGDREGAVEEIRRLQERVAAHGQNDLVLPTVPDRVDMPVLTEPKYRIPKTLKEMSSMESPTIGRLNDLMGKDPRVAGEFEKLANELGVNPTDGIAGLHSKLGTYLSAAERLTKQAAEDAGDDGILTMLRRGAKKFVRYGSARAADAALGGGWMGAAGRVFAGEGVGMAMDAAEDLVSGQMMQAKAGVRDIVAGMVSKAAPPTAATIEKLGPITAYLQAHPFGGGKKDEDDDTGGLTVKRINDVLAANTSAPEAMYIAIQSLLGHVSDVGYKLHQKVVGDIQHLADTAPKDPGIAMHGLQSDWRPSFDEALTYAYRIEAVTNPLKAIQRTIAGDGNPAAVETLWARWPALMQTAAQEYGYALHDQGNVPIDTLVNFSTLFRTPITGLMNPDVALTLQGLHLPKPEQQAAQSQSSGRPVGRPAAVQSQIVGTSATGLIA